MLLHQSYCIKCKEVTKHYDNRCAVCLGNEHAEAEARWKALSLESKVEALRQRIESIEQMRNF